ncbi:MAG: c-type cytochrome [Planctomycetota bacterium]
MRLLLACCCLLMACDAQGPDPDLNRMVDQPRYDRYDANPVLPGGATLQPPVPGSVPRERVPVPQELTSGRLPDGSHRADIPMPIGQADLQAGRAHFRLWCTPCHGPRGDGLSFAASRMRRRAPANLHAPRLRAAVDGHLFTVISEGHGYMAGYAEQLTPAERWQVVAFVRALQLSQHLRLDELDAARRAAIQEHLP